MVISGCALAASVQYGYAFYPWRCLLCVRARHAVIIVFCMYARSILFYTATSCYNAADRRIAAGHVADRMPGSQLHSLISKRRE